MGNVGLFWFLLIFWNGFCWVFFSKFWRCVFLLFVGVGCGERLLVGFCILFREVCCMFVINCWSWLLLRVGICCFCVFIGCCWWFICGCICWDIVCDGRDEDEDDDDCCFCVGDIWDLFGDIVFVVCKVDFCRGVFVIFVCNLLFDVWIFWWSFWICCIKFDFFFWSSCNVFKIVFVSVNCLFFVYFCRCCWSNFFVCCLCWSWCIKLIVELNCCWIFMMGCFCCKNVVKVGVVFWLVVFVEVVFDIFLCWGVVVVWIIVGGVIVFVFWGCRNLFFIFCFYCCNRWCLFGVVDSFCMKWVIWVCVGCIGVGIFCICMFVRWVRNWGLVNCRLVIWFCLSNFSILCCCVGGKLLIVEKNFIEFLWFLIIILICVVFFGICCWFIWKFVVFFWFELFWEDWEVGCFLLVFELWSRLLIFGSCIEVVEDWCWIDGFWIIDFWMVKLFFLNEIEVCLVFKLLFWMGLELVNCFGICVFILVGCCCFWLNFGIVLILKRNGFRLCCIFFILLLLLFLLFFFIKFLSGNNFLIVVLVVVCISKFGLNDGLSFLIFGIDIFLMGEFWMEGLLGDI